MATVINLTDLGSRGFVLRGGKLVDYAGSSVSSAGDIDGDGFDDVIVGASRVGQQSGAAYVIYGHAGGFSDIDLRHMASRDGLTLHGQEPWSYFGGSVATAGDVNGDGIDDIVIGARAKSADYYNGEAYVIYGKAGGVGPIDLANLSPSDGFTLGGDVSFGRLSLDVSSAGDINGDGLDDLIFGAYRTKNDGHYIGAGYVVFGSADRTGPVDLAHLSGTDGFAIRGGEDEVIGGQIASAGDVNNDGFADLMISSSARNGSSYVIFGKANGFGDVLDLSEFSRSDGTLLFNGRNFAVASAGDVNGDGAMDMIVGAPGDDSGGQSAGGAYVVFGNAGESGERIDLAELSPDKGFFIQGGAKFDNTGISVASAGDINGDGFADVIVGASGANVGGQAYVIFGKADGFTNLDASNLAPANGFILRGGPNDYAGLSVASAGDVNGDGFADIIVGGPENGIGNGAAYVIFGVAPTGDVTRIGSSGGQTIRGGDGDDLLSGLGGNDVLIGGAGRDRLDGGADNDQLHGGAGKDRLTGGTGDDVLRGDGGKDVLSGGAGADRFHFAAGDTAADAKAADKISDFHQAEHDLIDLSDYDADPSTPGDQPFHFVGSAAFSGAVGEVRYEFSGADTLVSGETDGDEVADFMVRLTGNIALVEGDFLLVPPVAASVGGGHAMLVHADVTGNPLLHLA